MSLPVSEATVESTVADDHLARRNALLRARVADLTAARAVGTTALGSLALGAFALGVLALGAVAIGRLSVGRARIRRLEIDDLVVRRLRVLERVDADAR
jgi:hypothetical protein